MLSASPAVHLRLPSGWFVGRGKHGGAWDLGEECPAGMLFVPDAACAASGSVVDRGWLVLGAFLSGGRLVVGGRVDCDAAATGTRC